MGVKPGHEEAILELMIPHIRGTMSYLIAIMDFVGRVSDYIDRCSTLNNVETVKTALKSEIFDDEDYEGYKVKEEEDMVVHANKDQPSKKNLMPTKEKGIATPMNQIKQEEDKRESGDIMEIEETETLMIALNLPEQPKESMGSAYSCIKESLETAGVILLHENFALALLPNLPCVVDGVKIMPRRLVSKAEPRITVTCAAVVGVVAGLGNASSKRSHSNYCFACVV
ncbi:hypothetical protein ACLB2K_051339 [Fragaria x ananassa]